MIRLLALGIVLAATACPLLGQAAYDTLYLHAGSKVAAEVVRIEDYLIHYVEHPTLVEKEISHLAVSRIKYAIGKEEIISPYVDVKSELDYRNVRILFNLDEAKGLAFKGQVESGTNKIFSMHGVRSANQATFNRIRRSAARKRCQFILIASEADLIYLNVFLVSASPVSHKTGYVFSYKE